MNGARSPRGARSIVAIGCGALALLAWLANVLEATLLTPRACSIGRMQYESYLLIARALAMWIPFGGLLFAAFARRESPRLRALGLVVCALGVAVAVAYLAGWAPALRMPCLRD